MADIDFIAPPKTTSITFALEPIENILGSLGLLTIAETYSGLDDWVVQTYHRLSPAQQRANRLVFDPFYGAVAVDEDEWPNFPAFIDHLAAEDATAMRDRAIEKLCTREGPDGKEPDAVELLADRQAFLAHVEHLHRVKDALEHYDQGLYEEAHTLLNDPAALKELVVSHLRTMWQEYMAGEWMRVEPMLKESIAAFEKVDFSTMSSAEAFRAITGRPVPDLWEEYINEAEHIIYSPSAHIGPYLRLWHSDGGVRVSFGARIPQGVQASAPALSRSELLARLSALADDTRLRILRLLSEEGELRAQDIMERLDLSQSAASRHLRQLTATGFLSERRREVAKVYDLQRERIDDTFQALAQYLK